MPIGNPYKSKFSDALAGEGLIAPLPANSLLIMKSTSSGRRRRDMCRLHRVTIAAFNGAAVQGKSPDGIHERALRNESHWVNDALRLPEQREQAANSGRSFRRSLVGARRRAQTW